MRKEVTGIYKIINLLNSKVYIGKSKTVFERIYQHKRTLRKGIHHNNHLQKSWDKYGEENFVFEVVEECDVEKLTIREIYWIEQYKSIYKNFGYNLKEETANLNIPIEKNRKYSKIYQISLDNKLIKIHNSILDAAREININHRKLNKKIWGSSSGNNSKRIAYQNYVWVREQDYIEGKEYYPKVFTRDRIGDKKVLFLTKDSIEEFIDMKTLGKEKNIDLSRCYTRVRYNSIENDSIIIWKDDYDENKNYFEKEKIIKYKFIHNETGEIIEMESINSEAIKYKLNPLKLYCLIKGKKKNKKGEYVDYSNYNGWGLFI